MSFTIQKDIVMRLALVSTPRSGNTWLRYLLANLYYLKQYAVHSPDDVNWSSLEEDCILQLHWHQTGSFLNTLEEHQFKVITIARHPLDVLISILHFAPHEPQTARWLNGEGGDESSICGQLPTSVEFLSYAISKRAKALLSVTKEWWNFPNVINVRYEDLVHTTEQTLEALCQYLGTPKTDIQTVVSAHTIEKLRLTSSNNHFWKGHPGFWMTLIPTESAQQIEAAHRDIFSCLNYTCTVDSPPIHASY